MQRKMTAIASLAGEDKQNEKKIKEKKAVSSTSALIRKLEKVATGSWSLVEEKHEVYLVHSHDSLNVAEIAKLTTGGAPVELRNAITKAGDKTIAFVISQIDMVKFEGFYKTDYLRRLEKNRASGLLMECDFAVKRDELLDLESLPSICKRNGVV